ncbi:bifunctional diguanylate cyclase/phosphodiesterase [Aliikangiella sp. G2MR2-5]|uniref:putative bifunctional diguanylate cyclase/phosphodiesterase n=1 Tax=Aliikangiella sp. G2MR2-5 TaxID=2788943 RepID=UPI0018AC504F|nr:EAL domain-containing protein [Aliikangiella sp. G2MR2-5]
MNASFSVPKNSKYFSLKWKVVLTIACILLLVNSGMSYITYRSLDEQFNARQTERLARQIHENEEQIEFINQRMNSFVKTLAILSENNSQTTQIQSAFNRHWGYLQVLFDLHAAQIFHDQFEQILSWGAPDTKFNRTIAEQVIRMQQPSLLLRCKTRCEFVFSVPLLDKESNVAALVMTHSIAHWLIDLKSASGADIGIMVKAQGSEVMTDSQLNQKVLSEWQTKIYGLTNATENYALLTRLSKHITFEEALVRSNFIQDHERYFNIQSIPIDPNNPHQSAYLFLINDITLEKQHVNSAIQQSIITGVLGVVVASLFIVLALWGPINHLNILSRLLSLLADGEFTAVKQKLIATREKRWIEDELDVLDQAGILLSQHLSDLQDTVKQREQELSRNALFDSLTGLANRRYFMEKISNAFAEMNRENRSFAVLFLDLDQFKRINDSLGHEQGDNLLKEVASRLIRCVRTTDTVARLGGDEFTILLNHLDDGFDASNVALKLLDQLRQPVEIAGKEVIVTTSIGIAIAPDNGNDPDTILRSADLAMYKAKGMGRDNYHYYTSSMNEEAQEQLALENELRQAIDKDEFVLYYQPQVDLERGIIIGMEALLRWRSATRGLVSPFIFMKTLEETGLIVPLGEKILRMACAQARAWNSEKNYNVRVAVNLSARQFNDPGLVRTINSAIDLEKVDSQFLELEITESMLMNNIEETINTLNQLKDLGLSLSIDDFGTGYSSLSYLKRFPVDTLKVDRTFVKDIPEDKSDMDITSAVIAMAHKLNLKVVAEGIESEAHVVFLKQNSCEVGQGYLFSKPVTAEEAEQLMAEKVSFISIINN